MTVSAFDRLYRSFEDRFRGPPDLIRRRLSVYLPLIAAIDPSPPNGRRAIDLGSGRGEWVSLIAGEGWDAIGVDLNEGMAQAALALGVGTARRDALAALRDSPDGSYALVTSFHLVEHLATDYLIDLVAEIRRVLVPGGLMILETPNPENVSVGTWSYHLDPTHRAPLPPPLLQFYAESAGFPLVGIVRLNGEGAGDVHGPLASVLAGLFLLAPDYACVAAKDEPGSPLALAVCDFAARMSQPSPAELSRLAGLMAATDADVAKLPALAAAADDLRRRLDDAVAAGTAAWERTEAALASVDKRFADQQATGLASAEALRQNASVERTQVALELGSIRVDMESGRQALAAALAAHERDGGARSAALAAETTSLAERIIELERTGEARLAALSQALDDEGGRWRDALGVIGASISAAESALGELSAARGRADARAEAMSVEAARWGRMFQEAQDRLTILEGDVHTLRAALLAAQTASDMQALELKALLASRSWAVTDLMRVLGGAARRAGTSVRKATGRALYRTALRIAESPGWRGRAVRTLARMPALDRRLRVLAFGTSSRGGGAAESAAGQFWFIDADPAAIAEWLGLLRAPLPPLGHAPSS